MCPLLPRITSERENIKTTIKPIANGEICASKCTAKACQKTFVTNRVMKFLVYYQEFGDSLKNETLYVISCFWSIVL